MLLSFIFEFPNPSLSWVHKELFHDKSHEIAAMAETAPVSHFW